MQLALISRDLGAVAVPLAVDLRGAEVALDQVRGPPPALPWPGRGPALPRPPGRQALLAHQRSDGVLADPPPGIAQVSGDPRGAVPAMMQPEQPRDLGLELFAALRPWR
jgi:hypothetical protein